MSKTEKKPVREKFHKWLERRVSEIRIEITAVALCAKDPKVPLLPKLIIAVVIAYALSPIDLIPDFIPVIGLLDDVLLLPLGIALAVSLIPKDVYRKNRRKAKTIHLKQKKNWFAAAVILLFWAALVWAAVSIVLKIFTPGKPVQ
jgi:uncharacterized membrane protein YkvA (DUF1232 family)